MKHRGLALVMAAACAVLTVIAAFIYLRLAAITRIDASQNLAIIALSITLPTGGGEKC